LIKRNWKGFEVICLLFGVYYLLFIVWGLRFGVVQFGLGWFGMVWGYPSDSPGRGEPVRV
jgi:hypothetical protein